MNLLAFLAKDVDPRRDGLLIVDPQNDFGHHGGALYVQEGSDIMPGIAKIAPAFDFIAISQDWHPKGHSSFASAHEGRKPFDKIMRHGHEQTLWPDHCVAGSWGACFMGAVPVDRATVILRKGTNPDVDSYSAFRENFGLGNRRAATGLMAMMITRGIRRLFICGLARDYCVKFSALDAVVGLNVCVLWDLTRAVDPSGNDKLFEEFKSSGVAVIQGFVP